MGTFRGLPPEVLELLGLEPAGDDDEPDEPCGPYELPHLTAEVARLRGWPVRAQTSQADQRRRRPDRVAARADTRRRADAAPPSVSRRRHAIHDRPPGRSPRHAKNSRPDHQERPTSHALTRSEARAGARRTNSKEASC